MRIVLDTNIYIAAALNEGGFSENIIKQIAKTYLFAALTSEEILKEVQNKLKEKFSWLDEDINLLISRIRKITEVVEITENISVAIRDPKDNKILECAISGNADLIVTIDQDLIKLKNFRGVGIIHPKTLSWTFPGYFKK